MTHAVDERSLAEQLESVEAGLATNKLYIETLHDQLAAAKNRRLELKTRRTALRRKMARAGKGRR